MFDTFQDLPVHSLVVHATVVILPLAAIMIALAAVYPRFRAWIGPGAAIAGVVAVVLVPITTMSGEKLEDRLAIPETCKGVYEAIEHHEDLATWLIWLVLLMALLGIAGYLLHRGGTASKAVVSAVAILSVLAAATVIVQTVRIGHAGSQAVWDSQC